jgi:hypothetical protein
MRRELLMLRPIIARMAVASFVWFGLVAPLGAQAGQAAGRHASFSAGASFGDGEAALALSATVGFPLFSRLGVEFELAYARQLEFTLDLCPAPRVCVIGGQFPVTGRTVSLVPHLVLELLPASRRLRAYVQAGIGAGHIRQRYFLYPALPTSVEFTRSSSTIALAFGGGATVQIARRLDLGADVRSLQLLDQAASVDRFITPSGTLNTLRIGSRVSWRF